MINIFFVPGMFGSTVEYVLRTFTAEHDYPKLDIQNDGSMHLFFKECHPTSINDLGKFIESDINTPIYPFKECSLPEILKGFQNQIVSGKSILMYADSLQSAELNMLFQYYKIANGSVLKFGLDIFCNGNTHNIVNWNKNYQHWSELQHWELREWLSLFYSSWVQEWIVSQNQVPDSFLKIQNIDLLYNTKDALTNIINFTGLTISKPLDNFVNEWQQKQQYIVSEFNTLDQIVSNTLAQEDYEWKSLCIISEAIIQQRLRSKGFEIRCDGLNTFPTNTKMLYSLLEKC
jgi:hypothetical protein